MLPCERSFSIWKWPISSTSPPDGKTQAARKVCVDKIGSRPRENSLSTENPTPTDRRHLASPRKPVKTANVLFYWLMNFWLFFTKVCKFCQICSATAQNFPDFGRIRAAAHPSVSHAPTPARPRTQAHMWLTLSHPDCHLLGKKFPGTVFWQNLQNFTLNSRKNWRTIWEN